MRAFIEKLLKFNSEEDEPLKPEQILANYLSFARELEAGHVEDIYKLINILGRKIQYEYFNKLIASGRVTPKTGNRTLIRDHLLTSYRQFLSNQKDWNEFDNLFREHEVEKDIEINLAHNIVLPWPWHRERLVRAFKFIGKDRSAGEWKYDESNHDVEWWEPIGIGIVHRGNHSMTSGVVSNVGKMNIKYHVDLKDAYSHIACDGNFYYLDQKKVAKVENLDFAIIFELGRILNNHGVKVLNI